MTTEGAAGSASLRRPEQERSRTSREAILASATELFAERGVEATSVTDVSARAGRSIGSIYHHFEHKDALIAAVVERLAVELEANVERAIDPEQWAGHGITQVVRGYVATSLALNSRQPGQKRITVEVSLVDPSTRDRYGRLRRQLNDGLTDLLLARPDEIGHPSPELAARFAVDQVNAMLAARLDPEMSPTQLELRSDEEFVAEVVASVSAYLGLP
ncbi:MAG: TetR/AcrR family transcriptional regulator [Actinomycetota bacterium]